jgi:hypothetical protein
VTVGTYIDALESEAPRIRLEAEGIPTFVDGSRMGSRSMYHVAAGGVKLQVPEALSTEARILLSQSWAIPEIDDDLDDAWDDLAPDTGFVPQAVVKTFVVVIVTIPLFLIVVSWLSKL